MNSLLYKKKASATAKCIEKWTLSCPACKHRKTKYSHTETHSDITEYKEAEKPLAPPDLDDFGTGKQANRQTGQQACSVCVFIFLYFLIKSPTWRLRPGECENK